MKNYPTYVQVREDVERAVIDYVNSSVELELHRTNINGYRLSEEEFVEAYTTKKASEDYFKDDWFKKSNPGLNGEFLIELMDAKVEKNVNAVLEALEI